MMWSSTSTRTNSQLSTITAPSTATTDDHDRVRPTTMIPVRLPVGRRPTTTPVTSTTLPPALSSSSICADHTRGEESGSEGATLRDLHHQDSVGSRDAHTTAASAIDKCTTTEQQCASRQVDHPVPPSESVQQETITTSPTPIDLREETSPSEDHNRAIFLPSADGKSQQISASALTSPNPSLPKTKDDFSTTTTPPKSSSRSASTMIFTDFHRSKAAAHRRRIMASTNAITEYEADLGSRDRMKQRDAIRRLLQDRVRTDWQWQWPQDERPLEVVEHVQGDDDNDESGWTERDEWESGIEDDDDSEGEAEAAAEAEIEAEVEDMTEQRNSDLTLVPSCDDIEKDPRQRAQERWTRKRKRQEEELEINDGLRCFTRRRDAWTAARLVRKVSARPSTTASSHSPTTTMSTTDTSIWPTSPTSTQTFSTQPTQPSSPTSPTKPMHYSSLPSSFHHLPATPKLQLQIPRPAPLLPPDTPLRKGISERTYPIIYDKVVVQCATPACPINLKDVVRSCVQGWKRDGEWPPKVNGAEQAQQGQAHGESGIVLARRKMHELGILGSGNRNGDGNGGGGGMQGENGKGRGKLKRGLHKVLTVVGGKGERKSL